jgi:hypothetical protein
MEGDASARYSRLHTPVETGTAPYNIKGLVRGKSLLSVPGKRLRNSPTLIIVLQKQQIMMKNV